MNNFALTPKETKIACISILIYLSIYSLESPIRYALVNVHLVEVILLRDLLILGPLIYITAHQTNERRINPVIPVFVSIMAMQAIVLYFNFRSFSPAILGAKLMMNVLLGLLVGAQFVNCSAKALRWLTILFVLTCVGLFIEKFITQFPWLGMSANIGGIDVAISHDWQVADPLERRVAGFTRESINAAGLLPFLGILLATRMQRFWQTAAFLFFTLAGVLLTTQKGALVAVLLTSGCIVVSYFLKNNPLRLLVLAGVTAQIVLPFATNGMLIDEGSGGVFTASSFAARVLYTWPEALRFVEDNSIGPFGIGLGGLGGPMRLIISAATWMFADNMFILMYAYFGVFVTVFYGAIVYAVWRSFRLPDHIARSGLALLAFVMWYGIVITGIEDQVISMALGLSLGCLLSSAPVPVTAIRPAVNARFQGRQNA